MTIPLEENLMSGIIAHFGEEIDPCFALLRQRGYSLHCFQRAIDLSPNHATTPYDLVSSSDTGDEECWSAADQSRKHLLVPSILFRISATSQRQNRTSNEPEHSDYDLVIQADQSPDLWISNLDHLIALGRRLRRATQAIVANSIRRKIHLDHS